MLYEKPGCTQEEGRSLAATSKKKRPRPDGPSRPFRHPKLGVSKKEPSVEVWTKHDFGPHEILLAPPTTEIKGCYWARGRSGIVHLPKALALNLGGRTLALDGRRRGKFAEATPQNLGELAKSESHGDLFFAIQRTMEKADANLHPSYVEQPLSSVPNLPNGKKQRSP